MKGTGRGASAGRPHPGIPRSAPPIASCAGSSWRTIRWTSSFRTRSGREAGSTITIAASPTPNAYIEGLLSQADEDARVRPLGTEDGYDRVLNDEVQLCGFTFALVPGGNPSWARLFKSRYPAGTWEIFPVAQVLAHDKTALLHHDLGKFVSDRRTLSWTLGLGFAMSEQVMARELHEPARLEWLRWLARIQQSIVARYVGEPVLAFEHEPGQFS